MNQIYVLRENDTVVTWDKSIPNLNEYILRRANDLKERVIRRHGPQTVFMDVRTNAEDGSRRVLIQRMWFAGFMKTYYELWIEPVIDLDHMPEPTSTIE